MPKTAGNTLSASLSASPEHALMHLPLSIVSRTSCSCRATTECVDHRNRQRIESWATSWRADRPLVVMFPHEAYDAIDWVRDAAGDESLPVVLAVRPRRHRLRSMFTDYWTQVAIASGRLVDDLPPSGHRARHLDIYSADAVHYQETDGTIDGVSWFTSFQRHGAGLPFFLDEAFGGDVSRLGRELDAGRLQLVTTSRLGSFVEEFTGQPIAPSRRISRVGQDPAIAAALADASHVIDELAERDAPFDRLIADRLGEPDFYVD